VDHSGIWSVNSLVCVGAEVVTLGLGQILRQLGAAV